MIIMCTIIKWAYFLSKLKDSEFCLQHSLSGALNEPISMQNSESSEGLCALFALDLWDAGYLIIVITFPCDYGY